MMIHLFLFIVLVVIVLLWPLKLLEDIGFKNVFNIGGFGEWLSNGGEIEAIN